MDLDISLFCEGVPKKSPLRNILDKTRSGRFVTPKFDCPITQHRIHMKEFLQWLNVHHDEIKKCRNSCISIAFFPRYKISDMSIMLTLNIMKLIKEYGIHGIELCMYPIGDEKKRYKKRSYLVIAAEQIEEKENVKLPPSIRRVLKQRKLNCLYTNDYNPYKPLNISYDTISPLFGRMPYSRFLTLYKFLNISCFPTFYVQSSVISEALNYKKRLEFFFNLPQRRGKKAKFII